MHGATYLGIRIIGNVARNTNHAGDFVATQLAGSTGNELWW